MMLSAGGDMSGQVFEWLSMDAIGKLIAGARDRVVLAAPGIDEGIAAALRLAGENLPPAKVQVILDVDEDNCRAGYGNVDGYSCLLGTALSIRRCQGLRIGFVLADDTGYIFGMPPLMVEAPSRLAGCPNAIRATPDQIDALVAATAPSAPPGPSPAAKPEIGVETVPDEEIKRIEKSIQDNPVQDFDLGRVVRVFSAHVQFVDLSVEGAQLQNHTVKIPAELLTVVKDKDTRDRLTAAFRMISDGSRIGGDKVRAAANEVRKGFIRVHPNYGGVILKSKRAKFDERVKELEAELEKHKEAVRRQFARESEKSKKDLVQAFWRAVRANPPSDLQAQMAGDKPTAEEAKEYLKHLLDRAFPDVDEVCDAMKVSVVTKDVTWDTLNDRRFVDWLQSQYPVNKDLRKPFEEYHAAKQRTDTALRVPA